jgi:hypothetical protein
MAFHSKLSIKANLKGMEAILIKTRPIFNICNKVEKEKVLMGKPKRITLSSSMTTEVSKSIIIIMHNRSRNSPTKRSSWNRVPNCIPVEALNINKVLTSCSNPSQIPTKTARTWLSLSRQVLVEMVSRSTVLMLVQMLMRPLPVTTAWLRRLARTSRHQLLRHQLERRHFPSCQLCLLRPCLHRHRWLHRSSLLCRLHL